ncbi:hypothetical protein ACN5ZK_13570 (plasmid) [Macrococcoides bohemicum]|uniref:hypothetical protein n=1 Tax=Macrococcoides bohemicum TaxID=1903056 RepID=UPI003AFFD82D
MKDRLKYDEDMFFYDLFEPNLPTILTEEDKEYLFKYERYRKVFLQEFRNNLNLDGIEYKNENNLSIALYYESEPGIDEIYEFITGITRDFELDICEVKIDKQDPVCLKLYDVIDILINLTLNKFDIKPNYDAVKVFHNNSDERQLVFSYYF